MIHQESSLSKFSITLLAVVIVVSLDVFVQLEGCRELEFTLRTFVLLVAGLFIRIDFTRSVCRLLTGSICCTGTTGVLHAVMYDTLAGVVVDQIDLVVAELFLAADAADREVVAVELSVTGEGGVTVDTPGLVDRVRGGGGKLCTL